MMEMLLFLMAVRTNCMPLPKCEKCDYFTDTPGFMLFKAHNIQNLLVLPAHQTPSVLHSFHSQHFRSGTQRLSSDNISFYLEREMCLCLWIIPHHFPHVQVFLESFKNMMPVPRFKLLIFILLYFPSCRVCSALGWKQCMWTSGLQRNSFGGFDVCRYVYVMERAALDFTGSNGGRGSVLICQIILPFTFPNLHSHKPTLLWYQGKYSKHR